METYLKFAREETIDPSMATNDVKLLIDIINNQLTSFILKAESVSHRNGKLGGKDKKGKPPKFGNSSITNRGSTFRLQTKPKRNPKKKTFLKS